MLVKEFGGLPWNLLFKEKPEFASGDTVLNCRLEEREGPPYTMGEGNIAYTYVENGQQGYFPEYSLTIDDVKIPNKINKFEEIYYIRLNAISHYLGEHKANLLSYWFKVQYEYSEFYHRHDRSLDCDNDCVNCSGCYSDFVKSSIGILGHFLNDDCNKTSNEEQHRAIVENYKALLLEMIPREETEQYGDFFEFFSKQDVVKKIDESHYMLKHYLTPQQFKYLSSEALSNGYISYELKYKELQPLIYMDKKERTLYSLDTWRKGKEKITNESGIWKPKFLRELFSK